MDKDQPWGFAAAAAEGAKKSKNGLEDDSDRNNSDKGRGGFGQLKGLFDGLSHLFITPALSRASRSTPNYNPNRRKPKDEQEESKETKEAKEPIKKEKEVKEKEKSVERVVVEKKTTTRSCTNELKLKSENTKSSTPISVRNSSRRADVDEEKAIVKPSTPTMSPSSLVKTAVNSKQHELERNRRVKNDSGRIQTQAQSQGKSGAIDDTPTGSRTKKRNNILATPTTPVVPSTPTPVSVLPYTNASLTGKMRNEKVIYMKKM